MAEKQVNIERPNIRIQIQNNIMNSMEVDDKFSDGEEGEIIEEGGEFDDYINDSITYPTRPTEQDHQKNTLPRNPDIFPLGIDIFDKREQQKRMERAKRFALELDEINNFTEKNLHDLYSSLGIIHDNDSDVCFEAIHMYGVKEMDATDVKTYFAKYVPSSIEWVNANSCNVIWTDRIAAARALYFLSKPIKGMPVGEAKGRSILLKNMDLEEDMGCTDEDLVSIRDINVPIPSGYWRVGVQSTKTKNVLLRFVLKSDKKSVSTEKFNVNYNKYNTANHGRLKDLESSKSRKGIFDRNSEISTKNPWGDLAKSWKFDNREVVPEVEEEVGKANPMMQHRLGFKRSHNASEEVEEKPKIPRMRMYADEEEEKIKRRKELNVLKRLTNPNPVESEPKDLRRLIRSRDFEEPSIQIEEEKDLGGKLKNRRLKFSPATHDLSEKLALKRSDARLRINTHESMTKQNRFREELLKDKHNSPMLRSRRSPPPKYVEEDDVEDDEEADEVYSDEDDDDDVMKTTSKVTVVIKKHKQPSVASTVWSRVKNPPQGGVKSRLNIQAKDKFEGKMRSNYVRDSQRNSSDDSVAQMSSDEDHDVDKAEVINKASLDRPGFRHTVDAEFDADEHKSPLRIEINNDHYHK